MVFFAKKSDIIGLAQSHNGIFRGKDLTNVYTVDQLYAKVSAGDFDDLYLRDYITVSITTTLPDSTVVTEDVSLMIAAFNYYYNCGDTALTKPHLVLIPQSRFKTISVMNTTSTTGGGAISTVICIQRCYRVMRQVLNWHLITTCYHTERSLQMPLIYLYHQWLEQDLQAVQAAVNGQPSNYSS